MLPDSDVVLLNLDGKTVWQKFDGTNQLNGMVISVEVFELLRINERNP